jgi:hypothetical protein
VALSEYEKKVFQQIHEWQNKLYQYEPIDFERIFDKYLERSFSMLPENVQSQFFSMLDQWMFHIHSLIQGSQLQMDAKERILTAGRIFDPNISTLADLQSLPIHQLQYIAQQQIFRHRFYSFIQGGVSGTGGSLLLGADIPAVTIINLRVVQLLAMTYGYEVNTPFEMMTSLKVFHAASLPSRIQFRAWEELFRELNDRKLPYFYEGEEEIADLASVEQLMKQIFKGIVIFLFKRKTWKGIPIVGMGIGASANYFLTRRVTEFAHNYYQMRYLLAKKET